MICWTLFLKTFLDHVSATGFCWKCFLDMCVGHVSRRQFFTINIWDMFFGQQRRKGHKIWKQKNRNHILRKPYRKHNHPNTTKENTADTFTVTYSWGSCLSPTGFDSPVLLFVFCFCLPLRGLQMPKNLSPHLLLFGTTAVPGVYVAHHNSCLLKHSVWCHCWCHPGLVLPPVSLPLSPLFPPNVVSCWGSQCSVFGGANSKVCHIQ